MSTFRSHFVIEKAVSSDLRQACGSQDCPGRWCRVSLFWRVRKSWVTEPTGWVTAENVFTGAVCAPLLCPSFCSWTYIIYGGCLLKKTFFCRVFCVCITLRFLHLHLSHVGIVLLPRCVHSATQPLRRRRNLSSDHLTDGTWIRPVHYCTIHRGHPRVFKYRLSNRWRSPPWRMRSFVSQMMAEATTSCSKLLLIWKIPIDVMRALPAKANLWSLLHKNKMSGADIVSKMFQ